MSEPLENNSFYGVLDRAVMERDRAELRFYEFPFSTEPESKPVFSVQFAKPDFDEDAVRPLLGCEVEVSIFEGRVEIIETYGDRNVSLRAASVSAARTVYDTEDYIGRVRQLDAEYERLNIALVKARKKILEGQNLTTELLRRAEIKAAASEDQSKRQAAVISVLTRLLEHLQSEA